LFILVQFYILLLFSRNVDKQEPNLRDFRLPPRLKLNLRSSVMLRGVEW